MSAHFRSSARRVDDSIRPFEVGRTEAAERSQCARMRHVQRPAGAVDGRHVQLLIGRRRAAPSRQRRAAQTPAPGGR